MVRKENEMHADEKSPVRKYTVSEARAEGPLKLVPSMDVARAFEPPIQQSQNHATTGRL